MATRLTHHRDANSADPERDETPLERLDRNTAELVQEMRVAAVGIQVVFAFLLVVPFNTGWKRVTTFDRADYFATLLSIALAAALLIAPSIHHRLLFRHRQKEYIVAVGNRMMIIAMVFMWVGLTGILVLISHVVYGAAMAAVVGTGMAVVIGVLWFALPLRRRARLERMHHDPEG